MAKILHLREKKNTTTIKQCLRLEEERKANARIPGEGTLEFLVPVRFCRIRSTPNFHFGGQPYLERLISALLHVCASCFAITLNHNIVEPGSYHSVRNPLRITDSECRFPRRLNDPGRF